MPISIKFILLALALIAAASNRGTGNPPINQDTNKPGKKSRRIRLLQPPNYVSTALANKHKLKKSRSSKINDFISIV
jgi:hypothetical protein